MIVKEPVWDARYEVLWNLIKGHDRQHPIKRAELLRQFNRSVNIGVPQIRSDRELRRMKANLWKYFNRPVGPGDGGYYALNDPSDLAEAQKYLDEKIKDMLYQKKKLREAFYLSLHPDAAEEMLRKDPNSLFGNLDDAQRA